MPSYFYVRSRIESRSPNRRGTVLLGGALLIIAAIFVLYMEIGFARYAFTGFLWTRTEGTVLNPGTTSKPSIQFSTRDGFTHVFKEDYILLCGGRHSLCFIRNFSQGQVVSVVYDPSMPQRAFVHDWALFAGVIEWFLAAGIGLSFALIFAVAFVKKPLNASFRIKTSRL